jgi:hypothetical protein
MQPTANEASQGVTEKYVYWNFMSQTSWTENSFDIADGTWSWHDAGGRLRILADGRFEAQEHAAFWNGRDAQGRTLPAGTYRRVIVPKMW